MTRHGKSIIELLVVISVFGAMITPMGRLLHTMMRSEREGAHALAAGTNAARLAREFRGDVHMARDVQLVQESGELKLVLADETLITYRPGDAQVERVITRREQTVSRDSFRLPPGTIRFESSGDPPLVLLLHERDSTGPYQAAATRTVLRVEAALGRDHRFAK